MQLAKNEEEIFKDFFAHEITAIARAYSPNKQKSPIFVHLPFEYQGDSILVNVDTYKKWNENFPINMIDNHIASLKTLNALKLDWGRNEQFPLFLWHALISVKNWKRSVSTILQKNTSEITAINWVEWMAEYLLKCFRFLISI